MGAFDNFDQSTNQSTTPDIDQINNQFLQIQNSAKNNTMSINETVNSVNELINTINKLSTNLNSNDALNDTHIKLSQLRQEMELFNASISHASQLMSTSANDVSNFNSIITSFANSMDNVNNNVNSLSGHLTQLSQINNLDTNIKTQIDGLSNSIVNFQNLCKDTINTVGSISIDLNSDSINTEQVVKQINDLSDKIKSLASEATNSFNISDSITQNLNDPQIAASIVNVTSKIKSTIQDTFSNMPQDFVNPILSQFNADIFKNFNENIKDTTLSTQQLSDAFVTLTQGTNIFGQISLDALVKLIEGYKTLTQETKNATDELEKNKTVSAENNEIKIKTVSNENPILTNPPAFNNDALRELQEQLTGYFNEQVSRLVQGKKQYNNIDGFLNSDLVKAQNDELNLSHLRTKKEAGAYNLDEIAALKNVNLFNDNSINNLDKLFIELQNKLLNYQKNYGKDNATIKQKIEDYSANPSVDKRDELSTLVKGAMSDFTDISKFQNEIADKIGAPYKHVLNNLPDEVKKIVEDVNNTVKSNLLTGDSLLKLKEAFDLKIDEKVVNELKNANVEAAQLTKNFEEASKETKTISEKINDFTDKIAKKAHGVDKFLGITGLPVTGGDVLDIFKGSVDYYKMFGRMDYDGALANIAHGSPIDDARLSRNQMIGIEKFRDTYGMVDFKEYANMNNTLLTNVQGKVGQDKSSAASDMDNMTSMAFDISKVFNISNSEMASIIKTFYRDLNLSAEQTNEAMLRLSGTAQAANIPVGEYMKKIGQLGTIFKGVGIDVGVAETAMRNFLLGNNMSESDAASMTQSGANAVKSMSQDAGAAAFYGMATGMYDSPYQAAWESRNLYNMDGSAKAGASDRVFDLLNAEMGLYMNMTGNMDANKNLTADKLVSRGVQEKDAVIMTNMLASGDRKGFSDYYEKNLVGKKEGEDVSQKELQDRIVGASSKIDELTKSNNAMSLLQATLSRQLKDLYDQIGKYLQTAIMELGKVMTNLVGKATDIIKSITGHGTILGKLGEVLMKHPLIPIAALLATNIASLILTMGSFAGKIGGLFGGGAAAAGGAGGLGSKVKGFFTGIGNGVKAGAGKVANFAKSPIGKNSLIGGAIDGGLTIWDDLNKGHGFGYSATDGLITGGGTAGGAWGGAAIGTAIMPGVGTAIGALVGGIGGHWAGDKAGEFTAGKIFGTQTKPNATNSTNTSLDYNKMITGNNLSGISFEEDIKNLNLLANSQNDEPYDFEKRVNDIANGKQSMGDMDYYKNSSEFANSLYGNDFEQTREIKDNQRNTTGAIKSMDSSSRDDRKKQSEFDNEVYAFDQSAHRSDMDSKKSIFDEIVKVAQILDTGFQFLDKATHAIVDAINNISIMSDYSGGTGDMSDSGDGASTTSVLLSGLMTKGENGALGNAGVERIDRWNPQINAAAKKYGVDPNLIKAIMMNESEGMPDVVSSAGAMGLMQLLPGTAKGLGFNPQDMKDPAKNLEAGAKYLKMIISQMGTDDLAKIVGGYGSGPNLNIYKDPNFTPDMIPTEARLAYRDVSQFYEKLTGSKKYVGDVSTSVSSFDTSTPVAPVPDFGYSSQDTAVDYGVNNQNVSTPGTAQSSVATTSSGSNISSELTKLFLTPLNSQELSNNAQKFNASNLKASVVDKSYLGNNFNAQSFARSAALSTYSNYKGAQDDYTADIRQVTSKTSASNPNSTVNQVNNKPNIKVDINVSNNGTNDVHKWATDIEKLLTNYAKDNMDISSKISSSMQYNLAQDY